LLQASRGKTISPMSEKYVLAMTVLVLGEAVSLI